MTQPQPTVANPFALLMDPQAVFRAIESSERLERLHSRICRPLDKPLLPLLSAEDGAAGADGALGIEGADSTDDEMMDLPGEEI